jgi:CRISPR-associated protein Cas5d
MLYDLDYSDRNNPMPRFFNAELRQGVVHVPEWDSEEVRG